MLAGGPIRRDLQAHRATARVAEQPPASTPGPASGADESEKPSRRRRADFRSATIAAANSSGRLPPTASQLTPADVAAVVRRACSPRRCRRPANDRPAWRCAPFPGEHQPRRRRGSQVLRTTSTRLVVGRETAESPGRCESRCSSKSVSRCGSAASRGKASAAAERSSACPPSRDDPEQAAPHTHRAPRAEHGSNSQELPRRADAISKAGVRRPDTGRVVCL